MPKAKKVSVLVIQRAAEGEKQPLPYQIMDEIIAEHHPHLIGCRIALAWNLGWTACPDNKITLGKCKKGSDLDRQLHGFDFVILLNRPVWENADFGMRQKRALVDHELCHAQVQKDAEGELVKDATGKQCYRIRKHDLEEFSEIVTRYGLYKSDVEAFAKECVKKAKRPLLLVLQEEENPTLPVVTDAMPQVAQEVGAE